MIFLRISLFFLLFFAGLLQNPAYSQDRAIKVVTSFSVLDDLIRQIGGNRVEVKALVGPNQDAHSFSPNPKDAISVKNADLVVMNGLGFDAWSERLIKSSGYKGEIVIATKGVEPIKSSEGGHSSVDPHAFQDIKNVKLYVSNICDALIKLDPKSQALFEANKTRYIQELDSLDGEIKSAYASIPKEQRRVVTSHDALGYYGKAYNIVFLAPNGLSNEVEPNAKKISMLIRQIKADNIKAVFVENLKNNRVIEQISKETNVTIGGPLFSDALSNGPPAGTYIDMMRNNTKLISQALK